METNKATMDAVVHLALHKLLASFCIQYGTRQDMETLGTYLLSTLDGNYRYVMAHYYCQHIRIIVSLCTRQDPVLYGNYR